MLKRGFLVIFPVILSVFLISSCGTEDESLASKETVGVRGTVVDEFGTGIANARVAISDSSESVFTDSNGDFYIEVLTGNNLITIYNGNLVHASIDLEEDFRSFIELDNISPENIVTSSTLSAQPNLTPSKLDCGAWGQDKCTLIDWEYWNGGLGTLKSCERGLESRNGVCRNDDRWQGHAKNIQAGWAYNAAVEQRKIARYEPLHWIALIGSHNAFNNRADDYFLVPNHTYSMTDQLNMGSRVLMLDVHHICDASLACEIRLSHGSMGDYTGIHWGASPNDRHFGYGIIEIKQWLDKNPGEVVILDMQLVLEDNAESEADFMWVLEHFLGGTYRNRKDYMLRETDLPAEGHWPSLAEMREMGKQVVVKSGDLGSGKDYFFSGVKTRSTQNSPGNFYPQPLCQMSNGQTFTDDIFTNKKRFVAVEEGRILGEYAKRGIISGDCSATDRPDPWPCAEVAEFTACGNGMLLLDFLGEGDSDGGYRANYPGERFSDLVWSWKKDVKGWERDNEAAVLEKSTGRWVAGTKSEMHRYACGRLREGDPTTWKDFNGMSTQLTEWQITQASGPFGEGGRHCAQEHGPDFVFSLPVNARQNQQLIETLAAVGDQDVWLAYRDIRDEEGDIYWDRDVPCIKGVSTSPPQLWPPNHQMVHVELEVLHECPIQPQCEITEVSSTDVSFTEGDWNIVDDSRLILELRSERLGQDRGGRTYNIGLECVVDPAGRVNSTGIDILVPHDQRVGS